MDIFCGPLFSLPQGPTHLLIWLILNPNLVGFGWQPGGLPQIIFPLQPNIFSKTHTVPHMGDGLRGNEPNKYKLYAQRY